jgi:CheY-like chemotaxis protein
MLRKLGCQVDLVSSGQEAVAAATRQTCDLVLMDIQMPDMDGYEANRQIRHLQTTHSVAHMPIIALTANAVQGDRNLCIAAGMDDCLSKPVGMEVLRAMFVRWQLGVADRAGTRTSPACTGTDSRCAASRTR